MKLSPEQEKEIKELAAKVFRGIERDYGYMVASMWDQPAHKMTDEQLITFGRALGPCIGSSRCG